MAQLGNAEKRKDLYRHLDEQPGYDDVGRRDAIYMAAL
jgi:hypothetical protein